MKVALWNGNGEIVFRERNIPEPGPHQVLIKIATVGICGTDNHIVNGYISFAEPPYALGHEFSGEVVTLGEGVTSVTIGQRVAVESVFGCGKCYYCRKGFKNFCIHGGEFGITTDGGWQEYLCVPEENLYLLPDNVSYVEAALMEMLNCPLGAVHKAGINYGDDVLVIGSGPAGLAFVQLAKIKGAGRIILAGTRKERQLLGQEYGAGVLIDIRDENLRQRVMELTDGIGVDMVIDAVGTEETLDDAIYLTRCNGKIIMYGLSGQERLNIKSDQIVLKALSLFGHQASPDLWGETIELVSTGKINLSKMVTHRFAFDSLLEAVKVSGQRKDGAIKVVVNIGK